MKTFDKGFWKYTRIFIIGAISLCSLPYLFTQETFLNLDFTNTGNIGDTIGGIMGPFIGIIVGYLTFLAFWIQYKANEQQKVYLRKQRFEDTFFKLLDHHQRMLETMDLNSYRDVSKTIAKGRDCFKTMYNALDYANGGKKNNGVFSIEIICQKYDDIQENYKGDLHNYFRFLYHILKFVFYADIEENEKYRYTSILRATLSPYEIVLIYYNGLHEYGVTHFKPLITYFSFLKNLDKSLLLHAKVDKNGEEIPDSYDGLAFANSGRRDVLLEEWFKTSEGQELKSLLKDGVAAKTR